MLKLTLKYLLSLVIFFFISIAVHAAPAPATDVDISIGQVATASKTENGRNHSQSTRSAEEISLVFDKNKGAIFRVYSRALRDNPALKGKIVFELVISPTGAGIVG